MGQNKIKKPGIASKIMVVFNLLLFLCGIAILFIGICTKNPGKMKSLIKRYGKDIPEPLVFMLTEAVKQTKFMGTIVLFTGLVVSAISFAGCVGACCSSKLLGIYKNVMMLLVLLVGASGIIAHQNIRHATPFIGKQLSKVFQHYDQKLARQMIHMTHRKGKCCGIFGPESWVENQKFQKAIEGETFSGTAAVPDSCCRKVLDGCGLKNNETFIDYNDGLFVHAGISNKDKTEMVAEVMAEAEWDATTMAEGSDSMEWNSADYDAFDRHNNAEMSRFTSIGAGGIQDNSGDHIYRTGCALKFGQMARQFRPKIALFTGMVMLPELICWFLAGRVKSYFDSIDDESV